MSANKHSREHAPAIMGNKPTEAFPPMEFTAQNHTDLEAYIARAAQERRSVASQAAAALATAATANN